MATITQSSLRCEGCGRECSRLYGGDADARADQCAICYLRGLASETSRIAAHLERVEDLVRSAVVDGMVHPDDVREIVERVLDAPDVAEWTQVRRRWEDIDKECQAFGNSMSAEVRP